MTELSPEIQAQLKSELHLALELDTRALGDVWRRTKAGETEAQIAKARNTTTSDFVRRELRIVHCIENSLMIDAPVMASIITSATKRLLSNFEFSPDVKNQLMKYSEQLAAKSKSIDSEIDRRQAIYEQIQSENSNGSIPSSMVSELGVFRGQRGIFRNMEHTDEIIEGGLAIGLLHTGKSYSDDLTEQGVLYDFPNTKSTGTDAADIRSLHNAFKYKVPVFVVSIDNSMRRVQRGWIEVFDSELQQCYVGFDNAPPETVIDTNDEIIEPWVARIARKTKKNSSRSYARDGKFGMLVRRRYKNKCAVTGIAVGVMLDAAHIIEVNDNGSDHPENGILLEKGIHTAFDANLWAIHPDTFEIVARENGPSLTEMGIHISKLDTTIAKPHHEALAERWKKFLILSESTLKK